jgi:hypothetical protein
MRYHETGRLKMYLTLVPAYDRDYKSKAAVLADFEIGKDFIVADHFNRWNGKPVNKENLLADGIHAVNIRYGKLRKVAVVKF